MKTFFDVYLDYKALLNFLCEFNGGATEKNNQSFIKFFVKSAKKYYKPRDNQDFFAVAYKSGGVSFLSGDSLDKELDKELDKGLEKCGIHAIYYVRPELIWGAGCNN